MAKVVNTSTGPRRVITPEEFEVIQTVREKKEEEKYFRDSDAIYKCLDCGAAILMTTVVYVFWENGFPLTGRGEYRNIKINVPYCPRCEEKPNPQGPSIVPRSYK